jgi:hypothetical protein
LSYQQGRKAQHDETVAYQAGPSVCPQCGSSADDDDYDHYNVEGSDPELRANRGRNQGQRGGDFDFVVPAMEAKAAQAQQQWEQPKAEQDAIVARYPELRGCTKDQVVFLDGGVRTVPVSEIKMPVTLVQADSIVARLR